MTLRQSPLWLPDIPFSLAVLMLSDFADTLLGDDVRAHFASTNPLSVRSRAAVQVDILALRDTSSKSWNGHGLDACA